MRHSNSLCLALIKNLLLKISHFSLIPKTCSKTLTQNTRKCVVVNRNASIVTFSITFTIFVIFLALFCNINCFNNIPKRSQFYQIIVTILFKCFNLLKVISCASFIWNINNLDIFGIFAQHATYENATSEKSATLLQNIWKLSRNLIPRRFDAGRIVLDIRERSH